MLTVRLICSIKRVRKCVFLTLLFFQTNLSVAQYHAVGFEFQAYPTGAIPGLHCERAERNSHWALSLRLGGNFFDHKDFGVHLSEKGKGIGGSVGLNYYFQSFAQTGLFLGLRSDMWRNVVHWVDVTPLDLLIEGDTRLMVVQPTALAGYQWGHHRWKLRLTAAFGVEVNAITRGEPTGQGLIFLLGIEVLRLVLPK